ncbi:MAG TPA: acyloxyacyl hydrolase [Chthoniobacteraceae bacterium]|jgi:hypothetical protein|nr:acyloxyacyl hydrolase [Chthoniobacteraceae bacterium]
MRLFLSALLAATVAAHAGTELLGFVKDGKSAKEVLVDKSPFDKGHTELEIGAGALASLNTNGSLTRPDTGYAIGQVRFGMMLYSPAGPGILRGNLEGIVEGYGAYIFNGPGQQLYGAGIILRYNFVQPQSRIVPFAQLMFGGAYCDAAHDDSVQRLLGSDFSFSFGGEVGARYFLTPKLALTGGVEYRHLSNANTADRNVGLNGLGGTLELSWFF